MKRVRLRVIEAVLEMVAVSFDRVSESECVGVGGGVAVSVIELLSEKVLEFVSVKDTVAELVSDSEIVLEIDCDSVIEARVRLPVPVAVTVTDLETVADSLPDPVADVESVVVVDTVGVGGGVAVSVSESVLLMLAVPVTDSVALTDAVLTVDFDDVPVGERDPVFVAVLEPEVVLLCGEVAPVVVPERLEVRDVVWVKENEDVAVTLVVGVGGGVKVSDSVLLSVVDVEPLLVAVAGIEWDGVPLSCVLV